MFDPRRLGRGLQMIFDDADSIWEFQGTYGKRLVKILSQAFSVSRCVFATYAFE
jgi:hypothetical protein